MTISFLKYPSTLPDKKDGRCPYCETSVSNSAWVCAACNAYRTYNNGTKVEIGHIIGLLFWLVLSIVVVYFSPSLVEALSQYQGTFEFWTKGYLLLGVVYLAILFVSAIPIVALAAALFEVYEFFKFNAYVGDVWRRPKR